MGFKKRSARRKEAYNRKSERYSEIGRQFENEFEQLLISWVEAGYFDGYERRTDREGEDFLVYKKINEEMLEKSFGITISQRKVVKDRVRHRHIPQFCFPIGTKPDTMLKRVSELFPK